MGKLTDLAGFNIGRIEVLYQTESEYDECGTKRAVWFCKCSCKRAVKIKARDLKRAMKRHTKDGYKCKYCREEKRLRKLQ